MADRKRPVALLPGESAPPETIRDPYRRSPLHFPENLGDGVRRSEPDQKMNVIGHASDGQRSRVERTDDTAEVRVDGRAPLRNQPRVAVFGCENDMAIEITVC